MALTPDQWLKRLSMAMDASGKRIQNLRNYANGNAPLPEGADNMRAAYQSFQKKARTNFGELVVDAVVERMIPAGFTVGDADNDELLHNIWDRNQLQVGVADVLRDMVALSAGYIIVSQDPETKLALVSCERPEQVITEQSAARPDQIRAALKVYRDPVEEIDVAFLHLVGVVHKYTRPIKDLSGNSAAVFTIDGGWVHDSEELTGLEYIPVFAFPNRGGIGEFESHTDILDRINWNILQRLVIVAMQAYRQRWVKGADSLADEDSEGNKNDYAAIFKPGAGALWMLPDGVEIGESSQTDITAILLANRDDITHLAAVTRTPLATLMPEGANQSAEGASFAREGLVFKALDRVSRAGAALQLVMGAALGIEKNQASIDRGVKITWLPVERQSLSERADAATKLVNLLPWRAIMGDVMQYSDEEINEFETWRDEEQAKIVLTTSTHLAIEPTTPPDMGA